MVDSAANDGNWAQHWIDQQRALLGQWAQSGTAQQPGSAGQPWSDQWTELGKSYTDGLLQLLQRAGTGRSGADAGTGFKPASEVLELWQSAWSTSLAQAAAPGGWSDLVNRSPPLGLFREQTEAWRELTATQADCQRLEQELSAVLRRVQTDALDVLEERVKARADAGSPVQGFRELYDLWVECSEQVFSAVAHSDAYCHLQAEMANASLRRRARVQKIIEQACKQFDLPTRSEINSLHQQLRALKQRINVLEAAPAQREDASKVQVDTPARPTQARSTRSRRKTS